MSSSLLQTQVFHQRRYDEGARRVLVSDAEEKWGRRASTRTPWRRLRRDALNVRPRWRLNCLIISMPRNTHASVIPPSHPTEQILAVAVNPRPGGQRTIWPGRFQETDIPAWCRRFWLAPRERGRAAQIGWIVQEPHCIASPSSAVSLPYCDGGCPPGGKRIDDQLWGTSGLDPWVAA